VSSLPDAVKRLIAEQIESVAQLEVLLLLHAESDALWTADEVAVRLRQQPYVAEATLGKLSRGGLAEVQIDDAGRPCFRFAPASRSQEAAVNELARKYQTHKTTIISQIFASPSDSIQDFADAFRLRSDH
jgi:hypothetical protein